MNSRRLLFWPALLLSITGCSKTSADSTESAERELSPVAQCLEDASSRRTPPADAPSTIDVAHILVRHAGISSPKEVTRKRGQACLRALAALEALQGGASWNEVVEEYSDSGKATHGELGRVSREELEPAFGDAAFALGTQELSYVVETSRGFHIILRNN